MRRKEREEDLKIEMQMIERAKYQEMLDREKAQAEEEYKQYLAYQFEQEQIRKNQNRQMNKQMEQLEDKENMAQFFQKHFARSIK